MNLLVFDEPPMAANLIKSILIGQRIPVTVSTELEDALRKISTALIDGLIIGPSGVPEGLADFIANECPGMPVILAGTANKENSSKIPLESVLDAPLSARRLISAVRRMEANRRARLERIPAEVAEDSLSIACRLADLTPNSLILCGESDEFRRWVGSSPARVQALIAGTPLQGDVISTETSRFQQIPRVGVRLRDGAARPLLAHLLAK